MVREELVELADGGGGQVTDQIVEVGQGFDAVQAGRADEAEQACGGLSAGGAAGEQPVFAADGDAAQAAFAGVVVDRSMTRLAGMISTHHRSFIVLAFKKVPDTNGT
jgi:hypothetical protein